MPPKHAMIVALLLLILSGSFATATAMALQDASWAMIGLGYMLGGWAGLLLGMPALLVMPRSITSSKRHH